MAPITKTNGNTGHQTTNNQRSNWWRNHNNTASKPNSNNNNWRRTNRSSSPTSDSFTSSTSSATSTNSCAFSHGIPGTPTASGSKIFAYHKVPYANITTGDIITVHGRHWAVLSNNGTHIRLAHITKFGQDGLRILEHPPWRAQNQYGPHSVLNAFFYTMHPEAYRFQDSPELQCSYWRNYIELTSFEELDHIDGLNFSRNNHRESILNFLVRRTLCVARMEGDAHFIGRFGKPEALQPITDFHRRYPDLVKEARFRFHEQLNAKLKAGQPTKLTDYPANPVQHSQPPRENTVPEWNMPQVNIHDHSYGNPTPTQWTLAHPTYANVLNSNTPNSHNTTMVTTATTQPWTQSPTPFYPTIAHGSYTSSMGMGNWAQPTQGSQQMIY